MPLIVTARFDPANQEYFDGLRTAYFPPERNYLSAHLTLFHAIPGDLANDLHLAFADIGARAAPLKGTVTGLRSLGLGVAFTIACPELEKIRRQIANQLNDQLTTQDRQAWRPHITIQNKATREAAALLLSTLQSGFPPRTIVFDALQTWEYLGGPWQLQSTYLFSAT